MLSEKATDDNFCFKLAGEPHNLLRATHEPKELCGDARKNVFPSFFVKTSDCHRSDTCSAYHKSFLSIESSRTTPAEKQQTTIADSTLIDICKLQTWVEFARRESNRLICQQTADGCNLRRQTIAHTRSFTNCHLSLLWLWTSTQQHNACRLPPHIEHKAAFLTPRLGSRETTSAIKGHLNSVPPKSSNCGGKEELTTMTLLNQMAKV